MRTYAERLGGRLIVESRGPAGGASVTCVMPLGRGEQEGLDVNRVSPHKGAAR